MGYTTDKAAKLNFDNLDSPETVHDSGLTLEEVRQRADISIMLPLPADTENKQEMFEYVTVNGKTTQIMRGEPVGVSWPVYEALKHGSYSKINILV